MTAQLKRGSRWRKVVAPWIGQAVTVTSVQRGCVYYTGTIAGLAKAGRESFLERYEPATAEQCAEWDARAHQARG
mgnify:CR=1 FL=1